MELLWGIFVWIGHAIEQHATGQLIRPRAKYVGPAPIVSQPIAPIQTRPEDH